MSLAQPAPEPRRTRQDDPFIALTPPLVPRLREYRVVPLHAHRKAKLVRAAIYVACFLVGIGSGLLTARLLGAPAPRGAEEQPVVNIRTLP